MAASLAPPSHNHRAKNHPALTGTIWPAIKPPFLHLPTPEPGTTPLVPSLPILTTIEDYLSGIFASNLGLYSTRNQEQDVTRAQVITVRIELRMKEETSGGSFRPWYSNPPFKLPHCDCHRAPAHMLFGAV